MKPNLFRLTSYVLRLSSYLLCLALCLLALLPSCLKDEGPPNVILIMSDDMGYSDIGCYGGEINTPNLDKLAFNGIRYTQFYNTARCCPTRASLLTGLHPHQTGIGEMTNEGNRDGYHGDLNEHCVTIAQVLKEAGYKNYMSGKWHVTKNIKADDPNYNWPLQRGFDRFYGTIIGAGSYYDPTTLCRDNTFITPENDPEYQPDRYYYTDAISDNAIRFIENHNTRSPDQPFFMYVAYTAAHWPMHALPEDIAKYEGMYDSGYTPMREARLKKMIELGILPPDTEMSPADWNWDERPNQQWERDMMEVYAAMVDCMDRGIGKIVDQLEESDQLDNTLIFFLQDNGACAEAWLNNVDNAIYDTLKYDPLGRDGLQSKIWPPMQMRNGNPVLVGPEITPGPDGSYPLYDKGWANSSNTPFRFFKHWIHEGGISTPLIMHWPKGIKVSGEILPQMGQLPDIMATIVDIAGAEYPETFNKNPIHPMEGISLAPTFDGETINHPPLYWEHIGKQGVRDGDWKLVAAAGRKDPIPRDKWELYNIANDRSELHNLSDKYPEKVDELAQMWAEWAVRAKVVPYPGKK